MSKKTPERGRNRGSSYVKAIAVLILVIFLSYWTYYSLTTPQSSAESTMTSSELLTTSTSTTGLNGKDFNLTASGECEFVNQTDGKTSLAFYLYLTNRLDMSVHIYGIRSIGYVDSATSGQRLGQVPLSYSLRSGNSTDRLVFFVTLPITGLPTGQPLNLLLYAAFDLQETGPIALHVTIPLSQTYPTCS